MPTVPDSLVRKFNAENGLFPDLGVGDGNPFNNTSISSRTSTPVIRYGATNTPSRPYTGTTGGAGAGVGAGVNGGVNNGQYTPPVPTSPIIDRTGGIGARQTAEEALRDAKLSAGDTQARADQYAATIRQARIDAINQTFAPRISRETEEGNNRLSRIAALNFNKGIVGSGVDTTKTGEQKKLNEDAMKSLENEKAIMINDAFNMADELGLKKAQAETEARISGAEGNVDFYKGLAEKANEALVLFGKSGTTLEDIKKTDPGTYNNLRGVSGLSDLQIQSILNVNSPTPQNVDTRYEDGYIISSYFDPQSKKFVHYTEKLDIPASTEVTVTQGDNGIIYAIDKKTGKVVNSFGERNPLYGVPKDAAGNSSVENAQMLKSNALTTAKELLNDFRSGKGTSAVGGNFQNRLGGFGDWLDKGTGRADFRVKYNNLKSLLSLDNVKLLKGQGAVSDAERRLLEQASAKLDRGQSEEQFQSALADIVRSLGGDPSSNLGGNSKIITAPDGTQVEIID